MEKKEIISKVAETIGLERFKKKLSQDQLSELAGISTKYLNLIENKKANPSIAVIVQICQALDISLNKLLEE